MPIRQVSEVIAGKSFASIFATDVVQVAAKLMKQRHISAVLVVDDKTRLIGICTERDVVVGVVAEGLDPGSTEVGAVMTANPRTIAPEKPFAHALHLMHDGGFRHVPVVDGVGRPLGLLSARDALNIEAMAFGRELVQRDEIETIL